MRLVCWRSCRCRRHRPWTIYSIAKVTTKLPGKKKRSVNNKRLRVAPCGCWPRNRVNNEHPPGTPRPLLNVNNVISTERVNVVTFWQAVNGNVNGRRVLCIVLRKLQAFVSFKQIRTKIFSKYRCRSIIKYLCNENVDEYYIIQFLRCSLINSNSNERSLEGNVVVNR